MEEEDVSLPLPPKSWMSQLNTFGKDFVWWGILWFGAYTAYQQGWLPFLQPPHLTNTSARPAQHADPRRDPQSTEAAEGQPDTAIPEDPASAVSSGCPVRLGASHVCVVALLYM